MNNNKPRTHYFSRRINILFICAYVNLTDCHNTALISHYIGSSGFIASPVDRISVLEKLSPRYRKVKLYGL